MDIKDLHKDQNYKCLEHYPLIYTWGTVGIFKNKEEEYFVQIEGQHDRSAPFIEQWKIEPSDYECFKKPHVNSLKKTLSRHFFEASLWDVFLKVPTHLELALELLKGEQLPKIENSSVHSWFQKQKQEQKAKTLFQAARSLGIFELPSYVHATTFISNDLLEVDLIEEGKDELKIRKCIFDIPKGAIINSRVISMHDGLPFFKFAKDYPIESLYFGDPMHYKASVFGQENVSNKKQVLISSIILKSEKEIYSYEYPKSSNLGRFFTFEHATSLALRNSVLFMYSFRDYNQEEDYYVLRFEMSAGKILPKTEVITKGDSTISFSTEGRMAFSKMQVNGRRSKTIEIVQL